jgi:hypothetical protein
MRLTVLIILLSIALAGCTTPSRPYLRTVTVDCANANAQIRYLQEQIPKSNLEDVSVIKKLIWDNRELCSRSTN